MPIFSIITPNFNSGEKLRRTISSTIDQGGSFEYIIVDGGSTDESMEIARTVAIERPGEVRFISEPDRNVYDAMNKGIRLATGRYLFFLGSGDALFPQVLERVEHRLPSHDRGFLYGNVMFQSSPYDGAFDRVKLTQKNICHQSIFYGREVFSICGEYNPEYCRLADWEMNLRCFGNRMVMKQYMDIVVANFEEGGISGLGDRKFYRDQCRLIRQHLGWSCFLHFKMRSMTKEAELKIKGAYAKLQVRGGME